MTKFPFPADDGPWWDVEEIGYTEGPEPADFDVMSQIEREAWYELLQRSRDLFLEIGMAVDWDDLRPLDWDDLRPPRWLENMRDLFHDLEAVLSD